MVKRVLIVGILLTTGALFLRTIPRVVTGISLMSVMQAFGLILFFWALWERRKAIRQRNARDPVAKQMMRVVYIVLVMLSIMIWTSVSYEIERGRRYEVVKKDLDRDDPIAALDLATHLPGEESAPLRKRIVSRIGELGNRSPRVTSRLRETMMTDEDRDVRAAAAAALAKCMAPRDVLTAIVRMPGLTGEQKMWCVRVLEVHTGQALGEDAAAWRRWLVTDWGGAVGEEAFALAVLSFRKFPAGEETRDVALLSIRAGVAEDHRRSERLARDPDPLLRAAVAAGLGRTGDGRRAPAIVASLRKETDLAVARRQVDALIAVDPVGGPHHLLDIVQSGGGAAGRDAAARWLSGNLDRTPSTDPAVLALALFDRLPKGPARRRVLDEIVRMARNSESAQRALVGIVSRTELTGIERTRALRAVNELPGSILTDADLVGLLKGPPPTDFAEAVRGELKRRTGEDGGRDLGAWRKILRER